MTTPKLSSSDLSHQSFQQTPDQKTSTSSQTVSQVSQQAIKDEGKGIGHFTFGLAGRLKAWWSPPPKEQKAKEVIDKKEEKKVHPDEHAVVPAKTQGFFRFIETKINNPIQEIRKKTEEARKNGEIEKLINNYKECMRILPDGEGFIELFEYTNEFFAESFKEKIEIEIQYEYNIPPPIIYDILRLSLANAFANLASQLEKNKNKINDYSNQSSLLNLFVLFNNKVEIVDIIEKVRLNKRKEILDPLIENIVFFLFPNGIGDIIVPNYSFSTFLKDFKISAVPIPVLNKALIWIFNYYLKEGKIKKIFDQILEYDSLAAPLFTNKKQEEEWKESIQKQLKVKEIDKLILSPSRLVFNLVENQVLNQLKIALYFQTLKEQMVLNVY